MAVVLIPWIAIADLAVKRRGLRRTAWSLVPYVGVVLAYAVWRFYIVDVDMPHHRSEIGVIRTVASAPWTIARYLAWLVLPLSQSAYVKNPFISGLADVRLYAGLAVVSAAAYLLYRIRRTLPTGVTFGAMLAVSFLPILNFVAVSAPTDMGDTMAERFLYFPSFAFCALAALALDALWRRWKDRPSRRIALSAALSLVVLALSVATIRRNRIWKNNEVFYRTTLETSPSALMWCNLANHYIHTGQWQAAKESLEKVRTYFSDDYHYLSSMALWYVAQRQYSPAVRLQKKAAAKVTRGRAVAYNNLAFLYRVTGDLDRAQALLDEIIYNGRGYADVYLNLAEVHRAKGELETALRYYREALARRPDNLSMATSLAGALLQAGRLDDAAAVFEDQLEMYPDNPGLLNNLGIVFQERNRPDRAEALFKGALERDPMYAKARLNLADLLLASGREGEAREHLERLVRDQGNTPEGKAALDRLNGFRPSSE
jgi:Tfp pilus assembly protein PilF